MIANRNERANNASHFPNLVYYGTYHAWVRRYWMVHTCQPL